MGKIWDLMRRDARGLRSSVVALVVLAGMVAVPSFYAWFNIAGSWDPYGNTRDLRVAVANEDAGYDGALVPVHVNLGERVVAELSGSESIGYVSTTAEDAVEGVRSGAYYAAVVIPEDFSRDLMSSLTAHPVRPEVRFYQNEKANAIASIVTDKAASAVQADVDEGFACAVTAVGAGALDEVGRALDGEGAATVAGALDAALADAGQALSGAAGDARDFSALMASTQGLVGSGAGAADAALAPAVDAGDALRGAASGLAGAGQAVDDAQAAVADALARATAGLDDVGAAVDEALGAAGAQAGRVREALVSARGAVDERAEALERLAAALGSQAKLVGELRDRLGDGPARDAASTAATLVEGLASRVAAAASEMRELSDGIGRTVADLDAGAADAAAARERLDGLVADARSAVEGAAGSWGDGARGALSGLASQVTVAADQADAVRGDLAATLDAADAAAGGAGATLGAARDELDGTAAALEGAAARVGELRDRLRAAVESGDADQVRAVLSAGPDALADVVAQPVEMERTAVFPVENNGSAMAPFYTTLAIWIGGVVLAALVRAEPSAAALAETGCGPAQAYLGRLALFVAVGLAQALLIGGGDLLYLGVQCAHPWLFLLACCASSLVYVSLIFSLTATLGDVGKALAVVLMVVQVAGSGGTFPPQMLPAPFQAIYQWLPFVHSEAAMRAALFGVWDGDYWRELGVLLAYLVPALAVGLLLRRPAARAGRWVEHRLERTRVM